MKLTYEHKEVKQSSSQHTISVSYSVFFLINDLTVFVQEWFNLMLGESN